MTAALLIGGAALAIAAVAYVYRPGSIGRPAPRWTLAPPDGGAPASLEDFAHRDVLLVFVSADSPPCRDLLDALPHWQPSSTLDIVVLAGGAAPAVAGVRVLAAPDVIRTRYRIAATPGALVVDGRGRIASKPAYGAAAIEALMRDRSASAAVELGGFTASLQGVAFELVGDDPCSLAQVWARVSAGTPIGAILRAGTPARAPRWTLLTRGAGAAIYRDRALADRADSAAEAVELLAAALRLHVEGTVHASDLPAGLEAPAPAADLRVSSAA